MNKAKYTYLFEEGNSDMRETLGGKGANLAEMSRIGLPVPPGFTVTTKACNEYYNNDANLTDEMKEQIFESLQKIEDESGKGFGEKENPLLVSVRSGAVASMPGMMDTVLNLGLNDETVEGLAEKTGNRRFALDSYRRFIQMFGDVVHGIEHYLFEDIIENEKDKNGVENDVELSEKALEDIIVEFKKVFEQKTGDKFPEDPKEQLLQAIKAVFNSWNNQRAKVYRQINDIPDDLGTAVNVQSMVFGNMGEDCGTGVAFTRNPSTGEKKLYGEFLMNAQGEDVVAGIRTPKSIEELKDILPEVYDQFVDVYEKLENHYRDMQDIEFTVEKKKLYLLQTRNGKRTAKAAVKIAVDMVKEGLIDKKEAINRVEPNHIDQLLHPQIDTEKKLDVIAKGLPASPGAASGQIVFDPNEAERKKENGENVVLLRPETTPDDIHGIVAAEGVLTSRGGMTSHAAVVARGMGKPCVSGCDAVSIDINKEVVQVDDTILKKGDLISIDGATGNVIKGEVELIDPKLGGEFKEILDWANDMKGLAVWANADTPEDAKKAREFGAEGIGLCRTEHMFMAQERIPKVRRMIMSETEEQRKEALEDLLPLQEEDFYEILKAMDGLPTTIRLLDPPLHEFLPNSQDLACEIERMKVKEEDEEKILEKEEFLKAVNALEESNPMLGHRGCRLGLTYPEIYITQAKAIIKAVIKLKDEGCKPCPEIMIPLVGYSKELSMMREMLEDTIKELEEENNISLNIPIGTMIELPRACVTADEISEHADFFSFGTNDLTQTTLGYSRDDAEGKFLHYYIQQNLLEKNPFSVLDQEGVGKLIETAVDKTRKTKPEFKLGVCGEHGGEPSSIEFFNKLGLNYVSCSPYRVPVARFAAARAKLNNN
ncbi:pyruvate, phosphate dikinase [Natranaerofaba carboxydovora]|uniref:pyruvate, phosphate dikinase n=1 Tax=Natranaerofaba carboxydovora TaxID=2742683 RepID=UPI001F141C2D|nr:pyruvate, phosphate dikinase [Natranaerofaba carboxydovora]UMZ73096.1 Pyruvate, phosphate dikinase [Natranaerofaba carboxydovora]